jgi:flagellar protein FliS
MEQKLRDFYLESQVNNASPGQMLIMLYDCLIQHAESADTEMSSPEHPEHRSRASRAVSRCIDIMTELNRSLRFSEDPKLCGTLSALYYFFTKEFSEAFDKSEPGRIRAILPLIRDLRNAWSTAQRRAGHSQVMVA